MHWSRLLGVGLAAIVMIGAQSFGPAKSEEARRPGPWKKIGENRWVRAVTTAGGPVTLTYVVHPTTALYSVTLKCLNVNRTYTVWWKEEDKVAGEFVTCFGSTATNHTIESLRALFTNLPDHGEREPATIFREAYDGRTFV
jgi:hypothetical protein